MSFIHINCLKKSIQIKITTKNIGEEHVKGVVYYWNSFDCEICLAEYPKYIKHKSLLYYLVDNKSNYEEYAQLELKMYDEEKKKPVSKGIIILNIKELSHSDVSIGRTNNNDLKLKDISVSRTHCNLSYSKGKIIVKNLEPKFGTLVYKKEHITLASNSDYACVLSGKCLIKVELIVQWSLMSILSCCRSGLNDKEVNFMQGYENLSTSNLTINDYFQTNTDNKKHIKIQNLNDSILDNVIVIENIPYIAKEKDDYSVNNYQHSSFI